MIFPPGKPIKTDNRQRVLQRTGPRGHHRGKACKRKLMRCKSAKTPLKTGEDSSRNVKTIRIAIVMNAESIANPAFSLRGRCGASRLELVQAAPVKRVSAFLW
ncbi:hypothetical protein [Herbaspirillum lusitanum]|uniref:hypothetical protein n=1 Tax=Herbaspirillum lusitanum TaxID=213312 RepID=UPI002237956D|nr:hypothetical protein [Herbaspirillum lusitanum]